MNNKFIVKIIVLWFLLVILAAANGVIRVFGYKPFVGELAAHQISTLIFIVVIFIVSYFAFRKNINKISDDVLLLIGLIWIILTEAFEFLAGHYLFGNSWEKLLADYNIFFGRIWILVLLAIFIAPYAVGRFLKNKQKNSLNKIHK